MHKFNIIFYLGLDPAHHVLDFSDSRDPFIDVYCGKNYEVTNFKSFPPTWERKFDFVLAWDIFHRTTKTDIKRILENAVDNMTKRSTMIATYAHIGLKEDFIYQDRDIIATCENRGLYPTKLNFLHPRGHTILLIRKGR